MYAPPAFPATSGFRGSLSFACASWLSRPLPLMSSRASLLRGGGGGDESRPLRRLLLSLSRPADLAAPSLPSSSLVRAPSPSPPRFSSPRFFDGLRRRSLSDEDDDELEDPEPLSLELPIAAFGLAMA